MNREFSRPIIIGIISLAVVVFVLISVPISAISDTLRYALIGVIAGVAFAIGLTHIFMYIFALKERYLLIHSAFCLSVFICACTLFTAGITADENASLPALQLVSVFTLITTVSINAFCIWFTHEILGLRIKDKAIRIIYIAALAVPAVMILVTGINYSQAWSVLYGIPFIIITVQTLTDKHYRGNPYVVTYICALAFSSVLPIIALIPAAQVLIAPSMPLLLLIIIMQTVLVAYSYYVIKRREHIITMQREREKAEHDITVEIQRSMLPNPFFPFPGRDEVELFADVEPAKTVAGDFYDYYFIDKYTLAVLIADGSSSGAGCAVFMSLAKALIKSCARRGMSPGEIFESVNNLLCEENRDYISIRAFLGFLHIPRGRFTYVNAGHYPPLIVRGEEVFKMSESDNGALAITKNARYTQSEISMQAGDGLFLYTDGVFSTENNEGEPYGEYRMIETVSRYMVSGTAPMNLIQSVKQDIEDFANGMPHSDDVTMLSLKIVR